jgi:two-component system, OmpR family, sensor histidine kinase VicK
MINKLPRAMIKSTNTDFERISKPNIVIETTVKTISDAKETFDYCLDSNGLSYFMDCESIWNSIITLKNKEIKSRLITEITTKNVRDSNLNMKFSEVFHSDKIKGNFLIVDGTKYLYLLMDRNKHEGQQLVRQLFSTQLKSFVDSQQYLFDNLCNHSIPAKEKIREIGRGINGDFVDIIRTPSEIHKIAVELIDSSTYEILLLFSTTNSF